MSLAVQQEEAEKLEVSVTTPTLAEDKQSRKAFEDALIAVYRREMGESPTANFGRIIDGYRQSTYRSGEERGGPLEPGQTECNTEDGVGPLDWSRSSDVLSEDWMGLLWSSPRPLADADTSIPTDDGLYRIWREGEAPPLEYIGQSSNPQVTAVSSPAKPGRGVAVLVLGTGEARRPAQARRG